MKGCLLIFFVLGFIACNEGHRSQLALNYDWNFEALNGGVKQITEISNTPYSGVDTILADFDRRGKIIKVAKLGFNGYSDTYEYKYDKKGKALESIKNKGVWPMVVCKFDTMNRIVEQSYSTKELKDTSDHFLKQDIAHFKYDSVGYLYAYDRYLDTKHLQTKKYKYNKKHLLIATEVLSTSGINGYKKSYKYQLFDKKGNWLKRIITTSDQSEKGDTVTRNIVYY